MSDPRGHCIDVDGEGFKLFGGFDLLVVKSDRYPLTVGVRTDGADLNDVEQQQGEQVKKEGGIATSSAKMSMSPEEREKKEEEQKERVNKSLHPFWH